MPQQLNGVGVHRPSAAEINPRKSGGIVLGPTPQKAANIVAKYTAAVPQVMIANPASYVFAALKGDVNAMSEQPVNGAELIAVSVINILQCWFEAYGDAPDSMPLENRVLSYWDCLRGLTANPLWIAPMNLASIVTPAISNAMINYDSCRSIEMKRSMKGYAYTAECNAYVQILGALVDGCAGPGPANLAMRDIREIFERIT